MGARMPSLSGGAVAQQRSNLVQYLHDRHRHTGDDILFISIMNVVRSLRKVRKMGGTSGHEVASSKSIRSRSLQTI